MYDEGGHKIVSAYMEYDTFSGFSPHSYKMIIKRAQHGKCVKDSENFEWRTLNLPLIDPRLGL